MKRLTLLAASTLFLFLPRLDAQSDGLKFATYGRDAAPPAQLLDLKLLPASDGGDHLFVQGVQPADPVLMILGTSKVLVPLPWQDTLLVLPEVVVPIGRLNAEGALRVPVDAPSLRMAGGRLYLQFFEFLAIDPYPFQIASSPGGLLQVII